MDSKPPSTNCIQIVPLTEEHIKEIAELEKENKERFERVDNEMMRGFSEEETEILRSMLLRIRDNLENPKGGTEG